MIAGAKLRNLFSLGEFDWMIPDGVTSIRGYNYDDETAEGSGKSAIPNGITWVIFGQVPKPDVKIDDVISTGAKTGGGSVLLKDGWQIARSRKPNDLFMIDPANPKKKIKGKDARETQKMIEEKIGMSYETWCQAVYFPQNYPKKFVTANEADKGKIASEIQDLGVFDKARIVAATHMKKIELELTSIKKGLEGKERLLDQMQDHIDELEELYARAKEEHHARLQKQEEAIERKIAMIAEIAEELETLDEDELNAEKVAAEKTREICIARRAELEAKIEKFEEEEERADKLELSIKKKQAKIAEIQDEIEECENPEDKRCRMCGTVLEKADKSHFAKHVEKLKGSIADLREDIKERQTELSKISTQSYEELDRELLEVKKELKQATHVKQDAEEGLADIEKLTARILDLDKDIEAAKEALEASQEADFSNYEKRIQSAKKDIVKEGKEFKAMKEQAAPLEARYNKLVTLRQGFKEVKSYVFQGLLRELTVKANRYLESLYKVPVRLEFSNQGEDGGISKISADFEMDGVSRSLGLCSGGQFRRVQLAVDLALSEIVANRGRNPMQLRFLDEYFKDLSESSMEKCLALLETLPGATILIEHNTLFQSIVDNELVVELRDKVTRRVQ